MQKIGKVPAVSDPNAELTNNGMQVTSFTPEQIQTFYKATQQVRDEWTKKIGPDLVKAAEEDMKAAQ